VNGRACRGACMAVGALALITSIAWSDGDTERLRARLDPQTASEVGRVVQEAREAGLPADALVSKALEGAGKGAPGPRIVTTVKQYAMALAGARDALGTSSSSTEIVAGAGALMVGVPPDSLARLRATRPGKPLVVPLVVLADLVARKVPASTATGTVLAATRAGARDTDLLALREGIEQDIRAGVPPFNAATLRGRALAPGTGAMPPARRIP